VDEFQDTDPLQAELALCLCAAVSNPEGEWRDLVPEPGRLCVVGDPKQSIYRFRRADIAVYSAVERTLVGADPRARVRLSVNFRSGRRIIETVNAVFGGADGPMRADPPPPAPRRSMWTWWPTRPRSRAASAWWASRSRARRRDVAA